MMIARTARSTFVALALAGSVLARVGPTSAAPIDSPTVCAASYQAQAQKLAVLNNQPVPFVWIRRVWTKTDIILDLQVYWPTGTRLYPGFACKILPNGTVVSGQSPLTGSSQ
jgi:hypothetical protein